MWFILKKDPSFGSLISHNYAVEIIQNKNKILQIIKSVRVSVFPKMKLWFDLPMGRLWIREQDSKEFIVNLCSMAASSFQNVVSVR